MKFSDYVSKGKLLQLKSGISFDDIAGEHLRGTNDSQTTRDHWVEELKNAIALATQENIRYAFRVTTASTEGGRFISKIINVDTREEVRCEFNNRGDVFTADCFEPYTPTSLKDKMLLRLASGHIAFVDGESVKLYPSEKYISCVRDYNEWKHKNSVLLSVAAYENEFDVKSYIQNNINLNGFEFAKTIGE